MLHVFTLLQLTRNTCIVILVKPPAWSKLILMDLKKKNKLEQNDCEEQGKSKKSPNFFCVGVQTEMETVG